jgi:hypothetical protein
VAAHGQLDESAITVAADQGRAHALVAHAMPSVTVMVQNSRGVPPARFTAR